MGKTTTIITGKKGEGKTTKLNQIIGLLDDENITCKGFIAPAVHVNGVRNTYQLKNISEKTLNTLCTSIPDPDFKQIGKFYFNTELIRNTESKLIKIDTSKTILIIDEIGPFELKGEVWSSLLHSITKQTNYNLLLSIRESLINKIIDEFNLRNTIVFKTNSESRLIVNNLVKNYNI